MLTSLGTIIQPTIERNMHNNYRDDMIVYRDQIANIHWIIEKAREFQKNIYSALLAMPKPLTVWITINCGKF